MGMKYKDPTTGKFKEINVKVADTLPVGSEVDYNGTTIPTGWKEVDSPNDYSTDEVRIGTYLGKPLYRKIITGLDLPSNNTIEYSISNLNISEVTKLYGMVSYSNGNFVRPLPFTADHPNEIRLDVNDGKIRIITYSNWAPYPVKIILEYTKTTD